MAVLTTGNTFSNGDQVTASSLNNAVNNAEFAAGAVDGISTQLSGTNPQQIIVKDLGISRGKIAIDAVGTDQLANDVVISTSGSITGAAGSFTTLTASGDVTFDTDTLKVDSTNNRVGIGTASPANALHVVGDDEETSAINTATATSLEVAGNGPSTNSGGTMLFSANGGTWKFAAIKALVQSGNNNSVGDLAFSTRPESSDSTLTEAMRIKYNGNVGIGTESPNAKLQIKTSASEVEGISVLNAGNTSEIFKVIEDGSNGGYVDIRNSSNTSAIRLNSSSDSYFNGGNVGIGITSPSKLLHVKSPNSDTAETVAGFGNGDIDIGLEIKTNGNGGSSLDWGFNAVNARSLVFDTNQNERMRITSTGNVGIGDNDPAKELVVKQISSAGSESIINIIAGNAGVAGVYFGDSDDDIVGGIVYDNSADTLQLRSSNNQTAVTINSLEQVGIGTTPSYKLDVNSGVTNQVALFESTDSTAYIELADNTGSAQLLTLSSGDFRIYTGGSGAGNLGTSKLVVEAGGNVGIGDDTPSYKLDVNGTGRFTSTTGGVILPRMTTTQKNAISSPSNGEMVYDTTDNKFYGYASGAWVALH